MVLTPGVENRGTGAARNAAICAAPADVYCFLDQDDRFLPGHLSVCVDAIAQGNQFVKTSVVLEDDVRPEWQRAIALSLVQNLAVTADLHQRIGGFLEDRSVAVYGCDDIAYNRMVRAVARGAFVGDETVIFRRHAGNSLDRQMERFTSPREAYVETVAGERLMAKHQAIAVVETALREICPA